MPSEPPMEPANARIPTCSRRQAKWEFEHLRVPWVARRAFTESQEMPSEPPMEPAIARIPTCSRRQAMDWSLVLASQGIETTIEHTETGWELLVPVAEYEHALQTLRQYQHENRHWR